MRKNNDGFEAAYNWLMMNYPKIFGVVVYAVSLLFIVGIMTNVIRV